jgi:hypothetical protein|tara:strand:+ start:263 stop:487 length:225 start_codon:yes stop_codon:yes gene_type:complete
VVKENKSMNEQLGLSENESRDVSIVLEQYVDYSNLGKTQAMERDLDILEDFINHYGETMIPLLDSYLKRIEGKS